MERVTQQALTVAHDGTDSAVYKQLLETQAAQVLADRLRTTAGCLVKEVCEFGATSKTPSNCTVEGCDALFSSGTLAVVNETACLNPVYKPAGQKYQK